ncbi:MAG: hypothetical protein EA409_04475 [Saprospirales bacterium]|nr:MAG: hypothetical protein EA409_04475 [Saprospirales bacterium]
MRASIKHSFQSAVIFIILLLTFSSCIKETFTEGEEPGFPDPVEIVESGLMGKIIAENGEPLSNAEVEIVSSTNLKRINITENGSFIFPRFKNKGEIAVVRVKADGAFTAYKEVHLQSNEISNTTIQPLAKKNLRTFHASDGAKIETTEGLSVTIPPGSFGNYNGPVDLFLRHTHTGQDYFFELESGGRTALNQGGKSTGIYPLGVLVVKFSDIYGNELQPSEDIEISFPATPELSSVPSGELSLYRYFEDGYKWVNMRNIDQSGAHFDFILKEPGYWTLAVLCNNPIDIKGNLKFPGIEEGLSEGKIILRSPEFFGYEFHLETGFKGLFKAGGLPSGFPIEMEIRDLCGSLLLSKNLGTFHSNENLGAITTTSAAPGKDIFLDFGFCRPQDMPGYGIIKLELNNGNTLLREFSPDIQQYFFSVCSGWQTADFEIIDIDGNKISKARKVNLGASIPIVNDVFGCFDPRLRVDLKFQLFDNDTGELVERDSLFLENPDDGIFVNISIDQNFEVTRVAFGADSDCFLLDLDIDFQIPVQIVKEVIDLKCSQTDIDWADAEISFNFEDLSTYTGGDIEFEANVFHMRDKTTGSELIGLFEFRFHFD